MVRSRFSLMLIAISGMAFSQSVLASAFNAAYLAQPPRNDGNAFRRPWQHGALTHHYNQPRQNQHNGKAHGFAPPCRPSKKKGHLRPSGRFY